MRWCWLSIPTLAVCVALLTAAAPAEVSDAARIEGQWVLASLEIDGEPAPEDQIASGRLVVEGNRYWPTFEGQGFAESIKLDPAKTPKSVDFTYLDGPRKGEKIRGIYTLHDDRFTICKPLLADDPRPEQIISGSGSGLVVVVWHRDTPAERARRKAVEEENKLLNGTWVGVFNRRDGQTIPDDEVKNARMIITRDRYTVDRGKDKTSRGFSKIDPTKHPKTKDVTIIDGLNKGQTWLGIYEVSGDTYRSCFATEGKPRPTDFSSEPGSGHVLWTFKREKD